MSSWLVRSTLERAVRVHSLAGDIVLCSWVRHVTLTVPLSMQVYKWVPVDCSQSPIFPYDRRCRCDLLIPAKLGRVQNARG